jgi:superfamily II DNA or RNA helicase
VDIPVLSTVILASPFASQVLLSQRLGRAARSHPDKTHGFLVDFYHRHKGLARMDRERRDFYEENGYTVVY